MKNRFDPMDVGHWRFTRSTEVNGPMEDWTPSHTRGDKIVGWVCVLIALFLLTGVVV